MEQYSDKIKYEVLDAGYKTPAICRTILNDRKIPLLPYTRPKGSKETFNKNKFQYDSENDLYICPNNEKLNYSTVTKDGYKMYKSNPKKCINCPLREQCTKSKTNIKSISRHVWAQDLETVNELRFTESWKKFYPQRKQTIERVFAVCKEQMGLRYTRVCGLEKNRCNASMIFACHNLKKMALWKWNSIENMHQNSTNIKFIENILKFFKRKVIYTKIYTTLSTV